MTRIASLCTLGLGLLVAVACERSAPPGGQSAGGTSQPATAPGGVAEERTTLEELKRLGAEAERRASEGAAAAANLLRQARELYQREVERESERMNERVNELRRKLESAAEDVRPALQKQLDEWTARAESARQTLERLKGASDEAWREMRKGVDNALQEYQEALEQPAPDAPPTTAPGK